MSGTDWRWVGWSAGLVFLVTILPVAAGLAYFGLDLTRVDLPLLCEFRNIFEQGQNPWLSRYLGNGEPFFANPQSQFFYPIRWLQVLLPLSIAPSAGVVLHWSLAAGGAAYLAMSFGIAGAAALAAGLFYAFSGTVLNLGVHTTYLLGAAYLPWVWGSIRFLLRDPSAQGPDLILLVTATALLFGGEPQAWTWGLALLGVECWGRGWKPFRLALGLYLLTFGIALVQWLPALHELNASRGVVQSLKMSLSWALDPKLWPGIVLPGVLAERYPSLQAQTWNPNPYLGTGLLLLAILGAWLGRRWKLTAIAATAFVFAAGPFTPVLPALMEWLRPLAVFRYPAKYFLLTNLAACVLAAAGWSAMRSRMMKYKWGAAVAAFAIAALSADLLLGAGDSIRFGPDFSGSGTLLRPVAPAGGEGVFCFSRELLRFSYNEQAGAEAWSDYRSVRLLSLPGLNACDRIISGTSYSVLSSPQQHLLNDGVSESRVSAARLLGCTHLVTPGEPTDGAARAVAVAGLPPVVKVYELERPIPQAFVESVHGPKIKALHRPANDRATVELEGAGPVTVGLRAAFGAGWTARQGGRELEPVRVGPAFLGVKVEDASQGAVEFRYRPRGWAWGATVSVLCLLAAAAWIRRRRRA